MKTFVTCFWPGARAKPQGDEMSTTSAYTTGYYIGLLAFLAVLGAIFWFVGRWGWIGLIIRVIVVGVLMLRVLAFCANPPPS